MNEFLYCVYDLMTKFLFLPDPKTKRITRMPASEWMTFPVLINILSRILNPDRMILIVQKYNDFRVSNTMLHILKLSWHVKLFPRSIYMFRVCTILRNPMKLVFENLINQLIN